MTSKSIVKTLVLSLFFVIAILPLLWQFKLVIPSSEVFLEPSSFIKNFLSFFDKRIFLILLRTILIALETAVFTMIIGTFLAFLFEYTNLPFKKAFRALSFLPFLIPPYILAIAWIIFLGAEKAYLNFNLPLSIYNSQTAVFILTLAFFPLVTLIVLFSLRNVDRNLEESARLFYAQNKVLRKITLPLIAPHVLMAGFFVFVLSFSECGVPFILRVNTFSAEVYYQFSVFYNIKNAILFSLPIILTALLLMSFYSFWLKKKSFVTISTFFKKNKEKIKLKGKSLGFSIFFIITLLVLSIVVPLSVLIFQSKLNFVKAFDIAYSSIWNSFYLGIIGATIMTAFSFFLAYFSQESKHLNMLILLPIAIPAMVIAVSMIYFWNTKTTGFLYASFWIVIIGYLARFLSFTTKTLSPFFAQISKSIEESAKIAGASFSKILKKIFFPLMKPGLIAAWLIGYIFCIRELTLPMFLAPPGLQVLPVRIETLMHYGDSQIVSALSLILIFMILIPFFIFLIFKNSRKGIKRIF